MIYVTRTVILSGSTNLKTSSVLSASPYDHTIFKDHSHFPRASGSIKGTGFFTLLSRLSGIMEPYYVLISPRLFQSSS